MKDRLGRLVPAVRRELREAAAREEARRADLLMRESEHEYRQLFDALREAVFVIEEKSGRVIDTNRRAEELLARTRAEIVGASFPALFAGRAGVPVLEDLRAASANRERCGCRLSLPRTDAPAVVVHASASPIELFGRRFLLVLVHELGERCGRAEAGAV